MNGPDASSGREPLVGDGVPTVAVPLCETCGRSEADNHEGPDACTVVDCGHWSFNHWGVEHGYERVVCVTCAKADYDGAGEHDYEWHPFKAAAVPYQLDAVVEVERALWAAFYGHELAPHMRPIQPAPDVFAAVRAFERAVRADERAATQAVVQAALGVVGVFEVLTHRGVNIAQAGTVLGDELKALRAALGVDREGREGAASVVAPETGAHDAQA
jgi:hypothetical protein